MRITHTHPKTVQGRCWTNRRWKHDKSSAQCCFSECGSLAKQMLERTLFFRGLSMRQFEEANLLIEIFGKGCNHFINTNICSKGGLLIKLKLTETSDEVQMAIKITSSKGNMEYQKHTMERKLIVHNDAEMMYVAFKELYVSFWPSDTGQRDRLDRDLPGGSVQDILKCLKSGLYTQINLWKTAISPIWSTFLTQCG